MMFQSEVFLCVGLAVMSVPSSTRCDFLPY